MLDKYWPEERQVYKCIRTEAEELSDHVLMAVHEPMVLEKRFILDNDKSKIFTKNAEDELLKNIKESIRPVPILGDSGSGKSHLIRLVDIKLRHDPETKDWLIKRIPKSASLREVLTILLDGLEGEVFDSARKRIDEVGRQLKTREVAEHLIVFMSHRLQDKYKEIENIIEELKKEGAQPDIKTKARMEKVKRHAKLNALPALLGDSDYKEVLLREDGCIFKIAKRLTSGSSNQELFDNDYKIKSSDLDLSSETINMGDLSSSARDYVHKKGLTSIPERQEEAVELLNEVLGEACNNVFQQFFQLHGGNFLDLFSEIRRYLKGKTLVILVEDMSLITAIESDLMTSLTREGIRDGVEEMCVVRSAIAVTTGYEGYLKHRNSLVGRNSGFEWVIERSISDAETLSKRILNFCGRYLNAARHGDENLRSLMSEGKLVFGSASPVWHSNEDEENRLVGSFNYSPEGYPLFPFNEAALNAYANKYCTEKSSGELVFNPRIILQHILIENLTAYRQAYLNGNFPPAGLGDFSCRTGLTNEISRDVFTHIERSKTLAAVWGFTANKVSELASLMNADIAREFGLNELADILDGTVPERPPKQPSSPLEPKAPDKKPTPIEPKNKVDDFVHQIEEEVEGWFEKKAIEQKAANDLRKELHRLIELHAKNLLPWSSLKTLPNLKKGKVTLIEIHYNDNNPQRTYASFGSDKEYKENVQTYKSFLVAFMRYEHFGNWQYNGGYSDYYQYQNFISNWVPKAIAQIVKKAREGLKDKISQHYTLACGLEPVLVNKTISEKLMFLSQSSEEIRKQIRVSGIEEWDKIRIDLADQWEELQKAWLDLVAINNHAIEGDLVVKALRGLLIDKHPYAKEIQKIRENIKTDYSHFKIFEGLTNKDDFDALITKLKELVNRMASNNQYKNMEDNLSSQKLKNRIDKLLVGEHWSSVKSILIFHAPFEITATISALNLVILEDVQLVSEVIIAWQQLYDRNIKRMQNENLSNGSIAREQHRVLLNSKIESIEKNLKNLISEGVKDV